MGKLAITPMSLPNVKFIMAIMHVHVVEWLCQAVMGCIPILECLLLSVFGCL
jgi:hypothetical protein